MAKVGNSRGMYRRRNVALAGLGESCIARTSRGHDSHVRLWHHADSQRIVGISLASVNAPTRYSARHHTLLRSDLRIDIDIPGFSVCRVGVLPLIQAREEIRLMPISAARIPGIKIAAFGV